MGKTIAVKVTQKEQQIIAELNKQGMTNSDVLRTALQQYFENLRQESSQESNPGEFETLTDTMAREYIDHLKEEIREVREQNRRLQHRLDQLQIAHKQKMKENNGEKQEPDPDIHQEIDAFLNHQIQKRLP